MTFGEVAGSLRELWDAGLLQGVLVKKTHEDYGYWLKVLVREFGERLLCQMTRNEVQDFLNGQLSLNSRVSSNKYLSVFKKVFRHGMELGAITANPITEISKLSEKEHERRRFILPREIDSLIAATKKNRGRFYMPAAIYLGAEHGASKQEILSLRWSDISFDFEGQGLIRFYRTKNRNERVEFLMPRSKEALLFWREHLERKRKRERVTEVKSDRVFARINGTPLKSFNKAWQACLKDAGIKDFHFHDLRHTFCSNLILSGAGLKEVKEMIGHKDISMTDRYSHLTLAHKLQQQRRLARHYTNGAYKEQ